MSTTSRLLDLLKRADAGLGRPLARLSLPGRPLPDAPRDALVLRLWGLGNLTLLAPQLHAARDRRLRPPPLARNLPFVRAHLPWVEALGLPEPLSPRLVPTLVRRLADLRRDPPEVVVDLEQFLRLPLLAVRAGVAAPTVGLDTPHQGRAPLLDRAVAYDPTRHVAHTFAEIWRAAGLPTAAGPGPLAVDSALRDRLAARLPPGDGPLVVVHPGSGDHFPGRRWAPERFGRLALVLHRSQGARVLVTGSAAETALVRTTVAASAGVAHDLAGRLAPDELVPLLALADLVVTNDTGPLHVADAVGTPAVALYGPNTPHRYGPRRPGSRAVFADLPCSPCLDDRSMKRSSCRRPVCMQVLSVEVVVRACEQALARAPDRLPAPTPAGASRALAR